MVSSSVITRGVLLLCLFAHLGWSADQPQWGQTFSRNMVSDEKGLPDAFDPASGKNVKWSVALGTQAHSTPVIAGGRVLIGTNNDAPRDSRHKGDRGVLMCLDEKDGHLHWQLVVPKLGPHPNLDWPRMGNSSPVTIEGNRVYTLTNRFEVVCLDLQGLANGNDGPFTDEVRHQGSVELGPLDGDIVWLYDMPAQAGIWPHDAAHSSILILGDLLYINTCNGIDTAHSKIRCPDGPSLIVLDKRTGRLVAKDDEHIGPRIFHSSWSSPALGEVNGQQRIFFCGGDGIVYAFEPVTAPTPGQVATLKKLWSFDPDPTAPKENVHQWFGNRRESPSNITSMPMFHQGRLYVTSGGDLWWGKNEGQLSCIDAAKGTSIWSFPLKRTCSTPAVRDGLVFVADTARMVYCIDAATGQAIWSHQMKGEIWASPMIADGKVYIGSRRGDFVILAAAREKRVLCSVDLDSPISATATPANGCVYIATMARLYAIALQR